MTIDDKLWRYIILTLKQCRIEIDNYIYTGLSKNPDASELLSAYRVINPAREALIEIEVQSK